MVEVVQCSNFYKIKLRGQFVTTVDTLAEAKAWQHAVNHLQAQVVPHLGKAVGHLVACEDNREVHSALCCAFWELGGKVPRIGGERGKDTHAA